MFKKYLLSLVFATLLFSCSEYYKILNGEDITVKYTTAEKLYSEGEFSKASKLFEQILPYYRGKPQAERLTFFLANCYFEIKDYYSADFQFENFIKSFPNSDKVIEAEFLAAKSCYLTSPKYSLDQTETQNAISKLDQFLLSHPKSEFITEVNTMYKELEQKIEKKTFEIAKLYYTIGDYSPSIKALDNFMADYPGTIYKENALYYKFKASYEIAINSIELKKKERLEDTYKIYNRLIKKYPETIYEKDLEPQIKILKNELEKYNLKI